MPPNEYLGNMLLLIVGGNDTTRNSMTGGVLALNQFSRAVRKAEGQSGRHSQHGVGDHPLAEPGRAYVPHCARGHRKFRGTRIAKGDKVAMWYVSGNRDETVIENPNELVIDRERPRQHLSFGFGIHRCVGNRLAEMQLKILWEEIHEAVQQCRGGGRAEISPLQLHPRHHGTARGGSRQIERLRRPCCHPGPRARDFSLTLPLWEGQTVEDRLGRGAPFAPICAPSTSFRRNPSPKFPPLALRKFRPSHRGRVVKQASFANGTFDTHALMP